MVMSWFASISYGDVIHLSIDSNVISHKSKEFTDGIFIKHSIDSSGIFFVGFGPMFTKWNIEFLIY